MRRVRARVGVNRVRSRRLSVRAAAVLLAAVLAGLWFPVRAEAVTHVAAQCNLVVISLVRTSPTNYQLSTGNAGLCAVSEFDTINLPWDAAQTGQFYVSASVIPAANVSCSNGRVASVSAQVSVFLDGSTSDNFFDGVSFFLSDAGGMSPSVGFLKLFTIAGAGQFVTNSGSTCDNSTWSLGSLVFEDPAV